MKKRLLNTNKRKLDVRNDTIRFNLALAYYKAALFPEAAEEFTKILSTAASDQPQRPNAVLLLADCQVRTGDATKVISRCILSRCGSQ